MSVTDGMRALLSGRSALRACLTATVVLGLTMLAVWPRGTLEAAIRTGQASDTFTVVGICFLLILLYLGARFGSEDLAPDTEPRLHELATLTRVSLVRLVLSRVAVDALHTAVLLLLGAPMLVASMTVGGVRFEQVCAALALAGSACLAARAWGLLGLALAGARRPLRNLVASAGIVTTAVAAFFFVPGASAFRAMADLPRGSQSAAAWRAGTGAGLATAFVLAAAAVGVLAASRARARRRAANGAVHA